MEGSGSTSLLSSILLIGFGFLIGRTPVLSLLQQIAVELSNMSLTRMIAIAISFIFLFLIYIVFIVIPLDTIAKKEAKESSSLHTIPTSFRQQLRRRGSFSMSFVTDVKAHVFASQTQNEQHRGSLTKIIT